MKYLESFFWGIIAALGALVAELIFTALLNIRTFSSLPFLALAALIEELFKFVFILKILKNFSQEKGFIPASLFLGLGFALFEISLIYLDIRGEMLGNIFNVSGVAVVHIATAGLMALLISRRKIGYYFSAFVLAFIIHLLFNLSIVSQI